MKNLTIVKVGGGILENPKSSELFLQAFVAIAGTKILIHGGGRLADHYLLQQGIRPNMVNGRRVTDKATLEVVTMVYGGLVNKQLVATLQSQNCQAIGLTGADGNLVRSKIREVREVDYGLVGDPEAVNIDLLSSLLQQKMVPVVAPLTHDGKGNLLNTNADTMATAIAIALAQAFDITLTFAFDKAGVLTDVDDETSVIPEINETKYAQLKTTGQIHSGMLPKLESAFEGLKKGIGKIRIAGFASISDERSGTTLLLEK